MNEIKRREEILNLVNTRDEVSFSDMKQMFPNVSEMTLRRDLEQLSRSNKLIRVLGGAKSIGSLIQTLEDAYTKRSSEQAESKAVIARKAQKLIHPNATIFLGSGTTTFQLARVFPNGKHFVITTGLDCAMELSSREDVSILMLGGTVNKNSYCVNGSIATQMLGDMSFNIAFLGVSGFVPGKGFSTSVAEDYVLRQRIVEHSDCTVILMDSSKVGRKGIYTFATMEKINYVISDDEIDKEVAAELLSSGITVL